MVEKKILMVEKKKKFINLSVNISLMCLNIDGWSGFKWMLLRTFCTIKTKCKLGKSQLQYLDLCSRSKHDRLVKCITDSSFSKYFIVYHYYHSKSQGKVTLSP